MAGEILRGYSGPEAPTDEFHVPVGYNATKCFMNYTAARKLRDSYMQSAFKTNVRMDDSHWDIYHHEPVWAIDRGIVPSKSERAAAVKGMPTSQSAVLSTIVGLDKYLACPENIVNRHGLLNGFIMSKIRFIGFAANRRKFVQNERDNRSFAVAISGIITRRVFRAVRVGDRLMLRTPPRKLLESGKYESLRGVGGGKVTLDLVPVRNVELRNFAADCLEIDALLRKEKVHTNSSVSASSMAVFGSTMREFVLQIMCQSLYRAHQAGYIKPNYTPTGPKVSKFGKVKQEGNRTMAKTMPGGGHKVVETPEQLAMTMAIVTGLIEKEGVREDGLEEDYKYLTFVRPDDMRRGSEFADEFVNSILRRDQSTRDKYAPKTTGNVNLAFTYGSSNGLPVEKPRKNGYNRLENSFRSAFNHLLIGMVGVSGLAKSLVVGMCIKDAQEKESTHFVVCQ